MSFLDTMRNGPDQKLDNDIAVEESEGARSTIRMLVRMRTRERHYKPSARMRSEGYCVCVCVCVSRPRIRYSRNYKTK